MSTLHEHQIKCSVCHQEFDIRRAPPVLHARRMRVHDVHQCPNCGYLVAVTRPLETTP